MRPHTLGSLARGLLGSTTTLLVQEVDDAGDEGRADNTENGGDGDHASKRETGRGRGHGDTLDAARRHLQLGEPVGAVIDDASVAICRGFQNKSLE